MQLILNSLISDAVLQLSNFLLWPSLVLSIMKTLSANNIHQGTYTPYTSSRNSLVNSCITKGHEDEFLYKIHSMMAICTYIFYLFAKLHCLFFPTLVLKIEYLSPSSQDADVRLARRIQLDITEKNRDIKMVLDQVREFSFPTNSFFDFFSYLL